MCLVPFLYKAPLPLTSSIPASFVQSFILFGFAFTLHFVTASTLSGVFHPFLSFFAYLSNHFSILLPSGLYFNFPSYFLFFLPLFLVLGEHVQACSHSYTRSGCPSLFTSLPRLATSPPAPTKPQPTRPPNPPQNAKGKQSWK